MRYWRTIVRSGLIGTIIGIIPGVGEDIGAWVSYAAARRASKEKEKYGKGSVEGLMAAETGNSAAPPGAIIPVLTLGIPGSAPAAIVLAAMVLHGVKPGPMIMIDSPSFVYEVVVMLFFAAVAMLVLGILLTPLLLKVLAIPRERLMPVVFVLCVIGSYAIQQRMFDVWVMVVFGIIGFMLREMKYPMAPLVLGIVLGDIFDKSFRRSWVIHDGDFMFYFQRPISVVLMLLCVGTIVMSVGPCRRYIGPRIQDAMSASVGLFTGFVRAHFVLIVMLVASLRGGKASEGDANPRRRRFRLFRHPGGYHPRLRSRVLQVAARPVHRSRPARHRHERIEIPVGRSTRSGAGLRRRRSMTHALIGGIGLTILDVYDQRPGPDGVQAGCAHIHAITDEAYFGLSGSGAIELHDPERGYRRVAIEPGTFVQFPAGTLHRSVSIDHCRVLAIMGNAGLPERGDARIYFGQAVDADPERYEEARALVSIGPRRRAVAARSVRQGPMPA